MYITLILYLKKNSLNKKVLLRERKRHTARCVANTPYVVLTGYPPGGYPVRYTPPPGGSGYPPGGGGGGGGGTGGGTRSGTGGVRVPPWGYPVRYPRGVRVPPRGVPGQVPPLGGSGYPPGGTQSGTPPGGTRSGTPGGVRVPPREGYPVRYPSPREGYPDPPPPPVDRQTPVKTVPSRRTTYAGGNDTVQLCSQVPTKSLPVKVSSDKSRDAHPLGPKCSYSFRKKLVK